jgi:hypothetical protein
MGMNATGAAGTQAVSEQGAVFLKQRKLLLGTWRSIGPVLAAGILIFYGTMWLAAPMFTNPFAVMNRLQENSVDLTTLQTMAIMLPVLTTLFCLALLGLIAHVYRAARIERKYQCLLEEIGAAQSVSR